MKVTICIVAKNEEEGISQIIHSIKQYADEIIVIDGRSTDKTFNIAKKSGIAVYRDHGRGRGDGVRVGLMKATGDIIVLFDADGSHNATDIPSLLTPIKKNHADIVIASRRTGGTLDTNPGIDGVIRSLGADLMTYLVNVRFRTNFTDILYSFRAIRKTSAPRLCLTANDFSIEQEMVVKAVKMGLRITEIPSHENARAWGISKLKTHMGFALFLKLLRQLL